MSAWAIDDDILERTDLDMTEKVLWAILKRLGAQEKIIWPSQQWLADRMGCSVRTVRRALDRLVEKGIVEQHARRWKIAQYSLTGQSVRSSPDKVSGDSPDKVSTHNRLVQSRLKQIDSTPSEAHASRGIEKKKTIQKRSDPSRTNSTPLFTHEQWQTLIDAFEPVNPMYRDFYQNTTERAALESLAKTIGFEKLKATIEHLEEVTSQPYAPKITKPTELKRDLGRLIAHVRQRKKQGAGNVATLNHLATSTT